MEKKQKSNGIFFKQLGESSVFIRRIETFLFPLSLLVYFFPVLKRHFPLVLQRFQARADFSRRRALNNQYDCGTKTADDR